MTHSISLSDGRRVSLRVLCLEDLPQLCRWFESISDKVNWAALDDKTVTEAALEIVNMFPTVTTDICEWIIGASAESAQQWPSLDAIRVLVAWLEVNRFEALIGEGSDFFVRLTGLLETVGNPSRRGGSTTSSTT